MPPFITFGSAVYNQAISFYTFPTSWQGLKVKLLAKKDNLIGSISCYNIRFPNGMVILNLNYFAI